MKQAEDASVQGEVVASAAPTKGNSTVAKAKVAAKLAVTPTISVQANGGRSAEAHRHVIICHATGSETNPFVVLNIPMTAWTEAHDVHQDGRDFILKDPASRPGSKDGFEKSACAQPTAPQVGQEQQKIELQACPPVTSTVTTTETAVAHHAGPTKVVVISPSERSAHFQSKHPDSVQTTLVTQTVFTQGVCKAEEQQVLAAEEQKAAAKQQQAAQEKQGGVLGAQAVGRQQAPGQRGQGQGGVLGAIGAVESSELPFTGIQLWIALLAGVSLVAAGLGVRRAMR